MNGPRRCPNARRVPRSGSSAKVIPLQRGQFRREHRLGTDRLPVGAKDIK